jgi:diaminopimelate decarboxylase
MESLSFLTPDQVLRIQREYGTPVYVYDQRTLETQAKALLAVPNAFGFTARYAMKALPSSAVVRTIYNLGVQIDASSGFEVARALRYGVKAEHIQITAQQVPDNLPELVGKGVLFNACSLSQLKRFGEIAPGAHVSVRINPGLGSGHSNRTNTGGPSSSFGIWHEHLDEVKAIARQYNLQLSRMHTHIGSGTDPDVWNDCAKLSLSVAAQISSVQTLSLGGGFKIGRMPGEKSTDLQEICGLIKQDFEDFHRQHGRKLHLELEPGTFMVANAGAVVCTVVDVIDTGKMGYAFIKIDSGMTEVLRPSLYGAQHPLTLVPATHDARSTREYVVVGHCCESGDLLTPEPGNPEGLAPRSLTEARIGDALVIGGAGAYCAAMPAKNYNSFPEAPEVLQDLDGGLHLIRKRQTLDQVIENELPLTQSSQKTERARALS